ncbi:MAG: succinylglutamate desuccinylase/aspartoacylase family protein [SAR324 cluster bacterium]|nr:succinylglutamate desuccinylase/aspartoacylase family protein [SAR324 cluster bacterium]
MIKNDYPLEISPVDIIPYRKGNTGVDYVTTIDSKIPGPHLMITALVHGNELCGAHALDFLFRNNVQPLRGKLTLGFANHEAYHSYDPNDPYASRFLEVNFNRVWAKEVLEGKHTNLEISRAREMRPIVDTVDYLFDIHSMQHKNPPLMIAGPLAKGRQFAREFGIPEWVVSDSGHAEGLRMRDYGGFGDQRSLKNALLVECGQHWEKNSSTVAIECAMRFLLYFKMLDPDMEDQHLGKIQVLPQKFIEVTEAVTIETEEFHFAQKFIGLEVLAEKGTLLGYDGDKAIKTPYDDCILVMPTRRFSPGMTAVRLGRFIVN